MPSEKSAFPSPPQYPPLTPRKLTANEEVARSGGRSYAAAKGKAPRTLELPARMYGQSGGSAYVPQPMGER